MKHITTDKGDLGVMMVCADLITKGTPVFMPVSATCPFDILIFYQGEFRRLQAKYRTARKGTISAELTRCTIRHGKTVRFKKNDQVDLISIYCKDTKECYYIKASDMGTAVFLRIEAPKNNQTKGVRLAKDYTELPNFI